MASLVRLSLLRRTHHITNPHLVSRASLSTTARLLDSARGRGTGPLPSYGPVGVAKALDTPPDARESRRTSTEALLVSAIVSLTESIN